MKFVKMHGCGNDYVLLDGFEEAFEDLAALAQKLCDRRFGVGGDGLLLVGPSTAGDGEMRIFNADGSEAEMCGNGIRCVARFLRKHKGCSKEHLVIQTRAGPRKIRVRDEGAYEVDMGPPRIRGEMEMGGVVGTPVSMGNPHFIVFVDDLECLAIRDLALPISTSPLFEKGANVSFVVVEGRNSLAQRTFERGVGETMACGTGACAAAAVAIRKGKVQSPVRVRLPGGELEIAWDGNGSIYMTGETEEVFRGER